MESNAITKPGHALVALAALEAAAECASDEVTRPQLNGVHVAQDGTVTGTDGHRLIQVPGVPAADWGEYPVGPDAFKFSAPGPEGIIIPTAAALEAAKAARRIKSPLPTLRHVRLAVNCESAELTSTDLDTSSRVTYRPVEGPYPSVEQVYPAAALAVFSIGFNLSVLLSTLKAFARVNPGPLASVKLTFHRPRPTPEHPNDGPSLCAVLIENTDGSARGLVMPVRLKEKDAK